MNSIKSSERHLGLLKGLLRTTRKANKLQHNATSYKSSIQRRQVSNFRLLRSDSVIKLREIRNLSSLSIRDAPILNPEKPSPEDVKKLVVEPIVPLTMPRFPKNNGVESHPSVTRILQATMPASSMFLLERWKEAMIKKLGAAGFLKYQQDTFERGRMLHSLLADYLLGHGKETQVPPSKEIVANLWRSIENVVKEKISNVRLVEHIVTHSDMKYRGIVDCVAFYGDELVVIDFKTAEKPKKTVESLFDNPLQVTAYCAALNNDKSIPEHVIDRNICAGLVIVAYVDGSEASVYYLSREKMLNDYWKQWTQRLDQYVRLEEMKQGPIKKSNSK